MSREEKKRSGYLTALLVFYVAYGAFCGIGALVLRMDVPLRPQMGLGGFCLLVFAIALWNWKRWGYYGLLGIHAYYLVILALAVHAFGFGNPWVAAGSLVLAPTTWIVLPFAAMLYILTRPVLSQLE